MIYLKIPPELENCDKSCDYIKKSLLSEFSRDPSEMGYFI